MTPRFRNGFIVARLALPYKGRLHTAVPGFFAQSPREQPGRICADTAPLCGNRREKGGCLTNAVRQPRKYSARLLKRVGRWRIIKV